MTSKIEFSFWRWMARGSGSTPGYRRLVNRWLIFHLVVGCALALIVPVTLATAAITVLLPLAGILKGLSFAWAGNAQALLQASEVEEMADFHPGGFTEYVFTYQAAILAILVTLVFWAIAGFEVFDKQWPTAAHAKLYFAVKALAFTLSSLTLRECWHIVLGAQWMLLSKKQIRDSHKTNNKGEGANQK
jgi:hypothetical protein